MFASLPSIVGHWMIGKSTFTGANGTAIESHNMEVGPDSGTFSTLQGSSDCTIQSNKADWNSGAGTVDIGLVVWDFKYADAEIWCTVNRSTILSSLTMVGLAMRIDPYHTGVVFRHGNDDMEIVEFSGGTPTVRASTSHTNETGDFTMHVYCKGSTLWMEIGSDTISYGSSSLNTTITKHGLVGLDDASGNQSTHDNLVVHRK